MVPQRCKIKAFGSLTKYPSYFWILTCILDVFCKPNSWQMLFPPFFRTISREKEVSIFWCVRVIVINNFPLKPATASFKFTFVLLLDWWFHQDLRSQTSISSHDYICIYHHQHVMPLARISLTLSRHFSLSFIASGRSSWLHPVSSHSC